MRSRGRSACASWRGAWPGARGAASLREAWAGLLAEERASASRAAATSRASSRPCARRWRPSATRARRFAQRLELDEARAFGEPDVPGALERRDAACAGWRGRTPSLREWCGWRRARRAAEEAGLEPLLRALEDGALPVADARAAFDHAWYARWCAEHFAGEPALKNFLRPEHERRVADFRALTARLAELTRDVLRARLAERVPPPGARDLDSSETGVLRRELRKKARHKPVRALLRELPNLVPRLKPVFLMSPLSVAQYLEPTHAPFDLVVFDEASQIPVWDAIGVLARARQAVIVGDPKQLPPTSFFQRGEDEDGPEPDDAVPEDLESILDEALASGLRTLTLDWHYRSRHESLIAFSNLRYYDGRLVTFPSPLLAREGVAWRPVPAGVYDRSGTRTNRAEAEAVVAEVVTRLKDPAHADRSLGVVTFNQAQQTLIEDLLEVARREDAALDAALASEAREALFVKNLENVQGDERDVILFSVTYGPDERGRVSLNFGPLNRDGGERRLNVAVTRARREVLVFSSLRPEHVDLARTTARGVADLKAFLEYADRGASALAGDNRLRPAAGAAHGLAARLAEALRARGYEVDEAVGASRFRVDLAVRDPRDAERYLVGLELDGPGYAASLTVRDRDASRPGVLAGLGWRLARLWSCDLYFDVEAEVARVLALVDAARAAREAEDAPGPSAAVEAPLAAAGGRRRRGRRAPRGRAAPGERTAAAARAAGARALRALRYEPPARRRRRLPRRPHEPQPARGDQARRRAGGPALAGPARAAPGGAVAAPQRAREDARTRARARAAGGRRPRGVGRALPVAGRPRPRGVGDLPPRARGRRAERARARRRAARGAAQRRARAAARARGAAARGPGARDGARLRLRAPGQRDAPAPRRRAGPARRLRRRARGRRRDRAGVTRSGAHRRAAPSARGPRPARGASRAPFPTRSGPLPSNRRLSRLSRE
ncbi:MAG: hypothetical protein H6828_09225 [Planctomycetes bacterium]|nr:hypothetical protein [Planctomycetota bacterium]